MKKGTIGAFYTERIYNTGNNSNEVYKFDIHSRGEVEFEKTDLEYIQNNLTRVFTMANEVNTYAIFHMNIKYYKKLNFTTVPEKSLPLGEINYEVEDIEHMLEDHNTSDKERELCLKQLDIISEILEIADILTHHFGKKVYLNEIFYNNNITDNFDISLSMPVEFYDTILQDNVIEKTEVEKFRINSITPIRNLFSIRLYRPEIDSYDNVSIPVLKTIDYSNSESIVELFSKCI
jgi:hypothetical protein